MPKTLRLTKHEEKALNVKCIETNKVLVKNGMMPIRESELAHKLLEMSLDKMIIGKDGQLKI